MYVYKNDHSEAWMDGCTSVCVYVCKYACIFTYNCSMLVMIEAPKYVFMHAYVHTYIYIHVHTYIK